MIDVAPRRAEAGSFVAATFENRSDQPYSWQCSVGELARWEGESWIEVGRSMTWDRSALTVRFSEIVYDCGRPTQVIEPGGTSTRTIDFAASGTGLGLTPAHYRIEMPSFVDGSELLAVGTFEVVEDDDGIERQDPPPVGDDVQIAVDFDAQPARVGSILEATVENRSVRPYSWTCAIGDLYRWDGSTWGQVDGSESDDARPEPNRGGDGNRTQVGWATWPDDVLTVGSGELAYDCGAVLGSLEPGRTGIKQLDLGQVRSERFTVDPRQDRYAPIRLGPGHYRLGFAPYAMFDQGPVAVGQFEIR